MTCPKVKGFTLIELMVAISIVAILASVGLVAYSKTQITARDSRRKQDLRSIQTALELYRQKNNHYPCSSDWQLSNSADSQGWIKDDPSAGSNCSQSITYLDTNYINTLPKDPLANSGNPFTSNVSGYGYKSNSITGATCPSPAVGNYFVLAASLENPQDPEANAQKNYTLCDGSTPSNSSAFVITSQ